MKAFLSKAYGSFENMEFEETEKPRPTDQEVLIEVISSSVNPLDLKLCEGELKFYSGFRFPQIYGSDVYGTVVEVGKKTQRLKVGDRVFGMVSKPSFGAFAEYTVAKEANLVVTPSNLSRESLGVVPLVGLTALQALRMAKIPSGGEVLLVGASGGVGHMAVQLSKILGFKVDAICSERNRDFVRAQGADNVFAYDRKEHVGLDKKYDFIFDIVDTHRFGEVRSRLKPSGVYANTLPSFDLFKSIVASYLGAGQTAKLVVVKPSSSEMNELASFLSSGELVPYVSQSFPLKDLKKAFEAVKTGRTVGKIAITID